MFSVKKTLIKQYALISIFDRKSTANKVRLFPKFLKDIFQEKFSQTIIT